MPRFAIRFMIALLTFGVGVASSAVSSIIYSTGVPEKPLTVLSGPKAVTIEDAEQVIRDLEREWLQALNHGDIATLDRLMSEDYILINTPGVIQNKSQLLAAIEAYSRSSLSRGWSLIYDDPTLRVFGDMALVNGLASIRNGGNFAPYRYSRMWVRKDGRWQAVYTQLTKTRFEAIKINKSQW